MPEPKDLNDVSNRPGGDEYGIITLQNPSRDLRVGDLVEFVLGQFGTTVNLSSTGVAD